MFNKFDNSRKGMEERGYCLGTNKRKGEDLYDAPFQQKLIKFTHANFNFCKTSKYFSCDTKLS